MCCRLLASSAWSKPCITSSAATQQRWQVGPAERLAAYSLYLLNGMHVGGCSCCLQKCIWGTSFGPWTSLVLQLSTAVCTTASVAQREPTRWCTYYHMQCVQALRLVCQPPRQPSLRVMLEPSCCGKWCYSILPLKLFSSFGSSCRSLFFVCCVDFTNQTACAGPGRLVV